MGGGGRKEVVERLLYKHTSGVWQASLKLRKLLISGSMMIVVGCMSTEKSKATL